jgi:MFS family permease
MGRISDRIDRRYVMVAVGLGGAIVCFYAARFPVNAADPGLGFFLLMTAVGAFVYPIYAVLVAHANDYARTDEYVEVSSGLLIVYGVGTMIGPLATARAIAWYGSGGMFLTMAAVNVALALYVAWRLLIRRRAKGEEAGAFQPLAPQQTPQTYALAPASEAETSTPVQERASI